MHADHRAGFVAGVPHRLPEPVRIVDRRQTQIVRHLREGDGPAAPPGVTAYLGRGRLGVPERHDAQRDETTARRSAPLFDHPVVVRLHALHGQRLVLGLVKYLPAEPDEVRETQRPLHVIDVHIRHPGRRVVIARAHVSVVDGLGGVHGPGQPGAGRHPTHRFRPAIVGPKVRDRTIPALHVLGAPTRVHDGLTRVLYDPRAVLAVTCRQPVPPQAGRLTNMIVSGHDPRILIRHVTHGARTSLPHSNFFPNPPEAALEKTDPVSDVLHACPLREQVSGGVHNVPEPADLSRPRLSGRPPAAALRLPGLVGWHRT